MSRPLLLAPLRLEAFAARRGAPGAEVQIIGAGPVRATAARARLRASELAERPVVLLGVGGALSDQLIPGDLVVASSVSGTETQELVELAYAGQVAKLLRAAGLPVRLGPILSSPRVVRGAQARQALSGRGDAVDMESLWCASLANRGPFVVVRAIVDTPGHELFTPSTASDGLRALRALARAARVLNRWMPSTFRPDPLMEASDL